MPHRRACWFAVALLGLVTTAPEAEEPRPRPVVKPAPGAEDPRPGQGGKYALLVGVRQYRPNTLRALDFTEADVLKLAEVLERSGYRRRDITILTQSLGATDAGLLPTGENIRAQLGIPTRPSQPSKRGLKLGPLDEDDTLLVGFAGHGVQFQEAGDSFFCPMDANLDDESSLIRLSDVSKALDGCRAGFKLLLVDACRDNPQIRAGRNGNREVEKVTSLSRPFQKVKPGGTMAMFSCSAGEVAFEDDAADVRHGIFFHHVIRALNGDPDRNDRKADLDNDGRIDPLELARYVEKNVAAHAAERFRVEQTVEVANKSRGSVAIVERLLDPMLTNSLGMKLKLIPAGDFSMGAASGLFGDNDATPLHRVKIARPFYLGVHEVTQREYREVTGRNPSYFSADGQGRDSVRGLETSRHPVEQVSWLDAVRYCNVLSEKENLPPYYSVSGADVAMKGGPGYRLPTEAEWEYACRAGSTTQYSFGDDKKVAGEYAWGQEKGDASTHPVGLKKPNEFGLHDMHGNVWEWCWDRYAADYYRKSPPIDEGGPSTGALRVCRGGAFRVNDFDLTSDIIESLNAMRNDPRSSSTASVYSKLLRENRVILGLLGSHQRLQKPTSTVSEEAGFRVARTLR